MAFGAVTSHGSGKDQDGHRVRGAVLDAFGRSGWRVACRRATTGAAMSSPVLLRGSRWYSMAPVAGIALKGLPHNQGFIYRPDRPNRRGPVPVYRSGLAGNRSVPVEFKFEFKKLSLTGSYRYTGRLDRFTGRFDRFTK